MAQRNAVLYRFASDSHGTRGWLVLDDGTTFATVELPWKDNRRNLSCIPPGKYTANYLARSASGKYKKVYHVVSVPGRGGILIHNGNFAGDRELGLKTHSNGCIIIGTKHGVLGTQRGVLGSRIALRKFAEQLENDQFTMTVVKGY